MKLFIAGGTGFVGKEIVDYALTQGHQVKLLVHNTILNANFNIHEVKGDVLDKQVLLDEIKDVDVVINLIGIIRETGNDVTFERIHIEATRNIIEAMKANNISRYVHMSALGVCRGATNKYYTTKEAAEALIIQSGLDYTIFRPSIIWNDESEFVNTIKDLTRTPFFTPIIGKGTSQLQPISRYNIAKIFIDSLQKSETSRNIFELGGPIVYTFEELIYLYEKGKYRRHIKFPESFVLFIAEVAELISFPFPATPEQLKMLKYPNVTDDQRIFNILGFAPERVI